MRRREFITLLCGAVAAWPLAARAQQPTMPVIGFLHPASPHGYAHVVAASRQGLNETGFVEGRNLAIEFRWAEDHADRLPAMAGDLARRRVSVLIAGGFTAAIAAKAVTDTIPIVFSGASDPVKNGLVASMSRPGGNITGMVQFSDTQVTKRLELLRELAPRVATIGWLVDPTTSNEQSLSASLQTATNAIGLHIRRLEASSQEDFEAAFALMKQESIGALVVQNNTVFTNGRARLAALAARYAIPTICEYREFAAAGGLISYGASHTDEYRQVGVYTGRILKGEKPADMPVVQPTKFQLVINLKTAKALGLTVPDRLLSLADEVIE